MYKKSEIEIEVLPANEGDCILITIEKEDIHILIDGGTAETYRNYLKTRLIQLKNEGKVIDLLIVTHIDNDHIGGIIELFKENGSDMDSKIIRIRNIWHNSYRHLQFEKNQKLGRSEKNILNKIIANGEVYFNYNLGKNNPISAMQGTTLAGLIFEGGYHWNEQFDKQAVMNNGINYQFGKECFITVLKPNISDLEKLGKKWKRDLKKSKYSFVFSEDKLFDDAFEYYCRCMPTNLEIDLINLINCYEKNQDWKDAEYYCNDWLKKFHNPMANIKIVRYLALQNRQEECLNKVCELRKSGQEECLTKEVLFYEVQALKILGKYSEAIEKGENLWSKEVSPKILFLLAECYYLNVQEQEAIYTLRDGIKKGIKNVEVYQMYAEYNKRVI